MTQSTVGSTTGAITVAQKTMFTESNFLSKLRNGAHEIHEVEFKGNILFMRLLSVKEQREAEQRARQKWVEEPEVTRLPIFNFHYEVLEILTRALSIESVDKEYTSRVTKEELEFLTEGEWLQLYQLYEDLVAKYNVSADLFLEDDRYMQLIDDLEKKKMDTSSLSRTELEAMLKRSISETKGLVDKLRTLSSVSSTTLT